MNKNELYKFIRNFSLEKYLNNHKVEYKATASESAQQFILNLCPFCNNINYKGNTHPNRLYVNQDTKQFLCYNCNKQGSLIKLLSGLEKLSVRQIIEKYLSKDYFESLPNQLVSLLDTLTTVNNKEIEIKEIVLPDAFESIFERPQGKFKAAYEYCLKRGINKQMGKKLDLRYCHSGDYWISETEKHTIQKRLIFPVYFGGKVIGFQGRDITELSKLKYYISKGLPKRQILFNYDNIFEAETITICEGIIDVIKCWDYNPIALFGKSLTDDQLELLQKMPNLKKIIIALDHDTKIKDKNGKIAYQVITDKLKSFWEVYEIELPPNQDAGDQTQESMNRILEQATPLKRALLKSSLV